MPYFDVYWWDDIHMGWGHAGTDFIIKAKSMKHAKEYLKEKPHDPFWIEHGIAEITEKEAKKILNPRIPKLIVVK